MRTLKITITGERGSGKTLLMNLIKRALDSYDVEHIPEICESIDSENITVRLSNNDLKTIVHPRTPQ